MSADIGNMYGDNYTEKTKEIIQLELKKRHSPYCECRTVIVF